DTTKADPRGASKWDGPIQNVTQWKTFPDSIADQSRIQTVADAHQRCFLLLHFKSQQIVEPPRGGVLHEADYFKVPKINIHPRIDDILRHAIKQFGRRDRLDNAAFILRAVVTKGRRTIKLASQRNSTARNCSSDYAKDKSTPSDRRAEFIVRIAEAPAGLRRENNPKIAPAIAPTMS